MMDGKTRPKYVERLTEINKLCNVASCWLYSANTQMPNLMKIRRVGAELVNVDRRADKQKEGHYDANIHFFTIFRKRPEKRKSVILSAVFVDLEI